MPHGVRAIVLEETGSTNAEALRRWQAGEGCPFWVMAARQSAGRGRGGREWISQPGNLFASHALQTQGSPAALTQLAFVAGLAVYDVACAPGPIASDALALKWPNDLLLDGAKVAGILIEAHQHPARGENVVIVGFGLNLASHPQEARARSTDLARHGRRLTPPAALEILAERFAFWQQKWDAAHGFAAIRKAWLSRAAGLGAPVAVRDGQCERRGIFAGLGEDGALQLKRDDGSIECIYAGDLFVRPCR